jgi:hypothetical protein
MMIIVLNNSVVFFNKQDKFSFRTITCKGANLSVVELGLVGTTVNVKNKRQDRSPE